MRALFLPLLIALALAACGREPAPTPPPGAVAVSASLVGDGAAVEVRVAGLTPGERVADVRLIGPDGRVLRPAGRRTLRSEAGSGHAGSGVGVGVTGGSSSGINPFVTLSLDLLGGDGGPERRERRVVARIPLPDPAAYRENAADWRIEVDLVDVSGSERTRRLPAP